MRLLFSLALGFALLIGDGAMAQVQTSITVHIHNNTGSSVSLYKVENGEAKRQEFKWPQNDTCFFSFSLEKESVFYIAKTGGKSTSYQYVLYVKPGDEVMVQAYSDKLALDFDSCHIQPLNAETKMLQLWNKRMAEYCSLGFNRSKRDDFVNSYSSFAKYGDSMKKNVLPNKYFNRLFIQKVDAEMLYAKAAAFFNYVRRMNSDLDTNAAHQSFYQALKGKQFCHTGILQSEYGLQLLNYSLAYNEYLKTGSQPKMLKQPVVSKAKSLCNDTVRGAFLTQYMYGITNKEQFDREIAPFKKSFVLPIMQAAYQTKLDEVTLFAKGLPAYNFKLPNTADKMYSLADFKGKVVVLDVWAMWCAPCLAEKPFFQKIEEEYKGNSKVVFVSVSVDGLAKKDVWKGFVAKKNWTGLELLADHNKSIMKYYKIEGIPRFMIFDAEGKIVTVDAPRPSDARFKELIEQTLNGKG